MQKRDVTIQDLAELFLRKKGWFFLFLAAGTAAAVAAAFLLPPAYRSSTLILVEPQKVPEDYVKPTVTAPIEDRLKTISQQITSRSNLEKIIEKFNLYAESQGGSSREEVVDRMRKRIELKVTGKDAFTIAFTGPDPETVRDVTNTLAGLFIEENLKVREQQAEGTSEFLESELAEAQRQLETQERALREFKVQYMGGLPQQLDANLRTLDRHQMELQAVSEALKAAEERRMFFESQLAETRPETRPDQLQVELARMKGELSRLRLEYSDQYPDIVLLKSRIREVEARLSGSGPSSKAPADGGGGGPEALTPELQNVSAEINTLKGRQKKVAAMIQKFEKRVEDTPANEEKLAALTRDYEISQQNYRNLLGKKLNARISENLEKRQKGEQFRILDPANLPEKPYKPNRARILLMGVLLSAGAGFGVIFLGEFLRPSFQKPEDLAGVVLPPVLAAIPAIPHSRNGHGSGPYHYGFVSVLDPYSVPADQYRILFSRIHQMNKDRSHKVLAVTSAVQEEGKTLTAFNLAVVMARDFGRRTLLIEGDFHRPALPGYLKKRPSGGLVAVLSNEQDARSVMINSIHKNLAILPAAQTAENACGLLSSPAMAGLIRTLREEFDYLLIDSPPVLPLPDMNVCAELVDGILLVVRAGRTPQEAVLEAVNSLPADKLAGIILNAVRQSPFKDYRYGYRAATKPVETPDRAMEKNIRP